MRCERECAWNCITDVVVVMRGSIFHCQKFGATQNKNKNPFSPSFTNNKTNKTTPSTTFHRLLSWSQRRRPPQAPPTMLMLLTSLPMPQRLHSYKPLLLLSLPTLHQLHLLSRVCFYCPFLCHCCSRLLFVR